jgi:isocitrate dehydrogenase (NAD+)
MFDASHGTAPDIAGQGKANPTAIFLAFALLLYHRDEVRTASAIKNTTLELLHEGICTPDVGGKLGTTEFTDEVAKRVEKKIIDPSWTSKTIRLHADKLGADKLGADKLGKA